MSTTFRSLMSLSVILLMTWSAADAAAQSSYKRYEGHQHERRYRGSHYIPYGYGYGFRFGYGPSTVAEGYLRGQADLVRPYGQANYYNSLAQVNWEQARAKNIENRAARVQQYFELRALNQQARFAQIAKSRLSKEQLVALSKKAAPDRLDDRDWNLATGGLAWPAAFLSDEFEAERVRVDELLRQRRDLHRDGSENSSQELQQLAQQMTERLKGRISSVSPADYVSAKRFITSVAHEARFEFAAGEQLAGR